MWRGVRQLRPAQCLRRACLDTSNSRGVIYVVLVSQIRTANIMSIEHLEETVTKHTAHSY